MDAFAKWLSAFRRYLVNVAACLFLPLLALGSVKCRAILGEIPGRLGWRKPVKGKRKGPEPCIPSTGVEDLIGEEAEARVVAPDGVDGNVSGYELLLIGALARRVGKSACFEIGTFDGRTTLNLAANTPSECHIYTLDLPASGMGDTGLQIAQADAKYIDKPGSGARFRESLYATRITQLLGDSARFDFGPYEGKCDLVFVDGAHSYDYVKSDTEVALRLLKPDGGVILWHDYASPWWPGVTRALNELYADRPEFQSMRHIKGTTLVVWEKGAEEGGGRREES